MSEGVDPHTMKAKLNSVGPGFCLAKWTQLSVARPTQPAACDDARHVAWKPTWLQLVQPH